MTERGVLPLPGYDHLALGDLAHRIRSDAAGLETLLDHERAHGHRVRAASVSRDRTTVRGASRAPAR